MKPTRDEILAEPAGPRLNAWVAEYIMGWPVVDGPERHTHAQFVQRNGEHSVALQEEFGGTDFAWRPSIDIAAAWQVVEKMGCGTIGHYPRGLWTAYFITQEDGILRHIAQAETAPLAICQAALLAVIG